MVAVAVVGLGYWGPNLVRNFRNVPDAQMAVCCDMDAARLDGIKTTYPDMRTVTRFEDVLADHTIGAVAIATPARSHYKMVKEALVHGKHVLVEKPLAMSSAECEELTALASARRLTLMVGHTFLYSPAVAELKRVLDSGELGELRYLYSQRLNLGRVQTDINALWSLAPHDVSIVLHLLGRMPEEVSATGGCYLTPGVHDVAFMNMRFDNQVMANVHVSWLDSHRTRSFTLVGSHKMAEYDSSAGKDVVRVHDKRAVPPASGRGPFELVSGATALPQMPPGEPLTNECRHFIECITTGRTPVSDGVNGLHVVRVLEAAQKSLESRGEPVRVQSGRLSAASPAAG